MAVDVAYGRKRAGVGAVTFTSWDAESASTQLAQLHEIEAAAYEPGRFFQRELPLLVAPLQALAQPADAVVIDGYVQLSGDGAPGLGAHLHAALGGRTPIIGVAKTRYRGDDWSAQVLRGRSAKPLFVTAIGMAQEEAAGAVRAMAGAHRIPDRLSEVDRLARAVLAQ